MGLLCNLTKLVAIILTVYCSCNYVVSATAARTSNYVASTAANYGININNNSVNTQKQQQQQFLEVHNKYRRQTGVPNLKWDSNLAEYAASYASKVQCRMVHSGGRYGENLFWGSSGSTWTPADAVHLWYSEVRNYNYESNSCKSGAVCGHYTQVVWRSTAAVGCAMRVCAGSGTLAVCEYNPPGNYIGKRPY